MSNDTTFNTLGASCNSYVPQEPIYMHVRREVFLHMGIGNPLNPLDFDAIASKIIVAANDVNPPFTTIIPTDYSQTVTVYPCENPNQGIEGIANLKALRIITSGTYMPVLYSPSIMRIFAEEEQFIGLDQVVGYISPTDPIPSNSSFDIDIDLLNGPVPTDSSESQYIGFVFMDFALDNALGDPNGPGTYFFVVHPMAKIKKTSDPS